MSETASDRQKRLENAGRVLVTVVENIRLRRALRNVCYSPSLAFWRAIYNAVFDVVFLDWCKLFGSQDENLHWKNVVQDQAQFRKGLLDRLHVSQEEWELYRNEMMANRNKSIAHYDEVREDDSTFQTFDYALESAYFYYESVVGELQKFDVEDFSPRSLREYSEKFGDECDAIAKRLNDLHIDYESSVY